MILQDIRYYVATTIKDVEADVKNQNRIEMTKELWNHDMAIPPEPQPTRPAELDAKTGTPVGHMVQGYMSPRTR